ncbi:MAG: hypothetical protein HY064_12860 [Bacteroidetes bacterium]|nr:hypothetical protein [Bacteroidota bacterium]
MKKIILPLAICGALFTSFAFTGSNACDGNDFFTKGTVATNGYYKADGTQTGTGTSTVTDITTSGDSTIATMTSSYQDAKKKDPPRDVTVRMICLKDKLVMDLGNMMGSASPQASGSNIKVVMLGSLVPYKTSYTAGEKLDDIHMTMQMFSNGSLFSTSDILINNRVVDAVEDHTTSAGTFHCFKISSMSSVTTKMGNMTLPGGKANKSVEWYSPVAGMVRSESYKDDKLMSYTELIGLIKP